MTLSRQSIGHDVTQLMDSTHSDQMTNHQRRISNSTFTASTTSIPTCITAFRHRRLSSSPILLSLILLLSLLSCLLLATPTLATFKQGSMYTDNSWQYLEKFCFDEAGGRVEFTFIEDANADYHTQEVSFYADEEADWYSVYGNDGLTCAQKRDVAKKTFPLYKLQDPAYNGTYHYDIGGIIPRWWFITVENCATATRPDGTLKIAYWKIHFTNKAGLFQYEFSKDVQGILEMSIFFLILYWLMMFMLAWIKNHAKQKNLQYTVVKYIFVSMLIEWIGLLFEMAHYAKLAHDGIGVVELDYAHDFFEFISNLVLLYAVINISKGWAISTNFIPDRRISYIVIAILLFLFIALFSWQQTILDPASVLYIYETPPGWTLVAVRCALSLYAIYCVIVTYKLETEVSKKQFYIVWCVLAVSWLASLPIIVGIAHSLDSWKRRRAVFGLVNSVQAVMYIALTYLFRPFRSNRYVDILKPDESRAFGTNNMQVFPSGPDTQIQFATI